MASDMVISEDEVLLYEERDAPAECEGTEAENIAAAYRDIYEEAVRTNTLGSLETLRCIVSRLDERGYVAAHASLRQYWRIRPLSDRCRELTEKYVFGLSYTSYDVLTTDWDSSNVENGDGTFRYLSNTME